ncbi:MAG TPA: type II secretion system protein M [Acidiferrobacterales bacterium]|nr:type II secretion system protein M [Acidiferrobacterales bacterium]
MKHELLQNYLTRWQSLQPRERFALTIAGVVLLIVVFYLLLWSPIQRDLASLRVTVPQDRAKLTVMRAQALQVARLRTASAQSPSDNLLSALEQSAATRGLRQYIGRIEPEGANGARVVIEEVNFNNLLTWLVDLQGRGIRVENAVLQRKSNPGAVSARLLLRSPGA